MFNRRTVLALAGGLLPSTGSALAAQSNSATQRSISPFTLDFTVLFRLDDPKIALRPGTAESANYNVATWIAPQGRPADVETKARSAALAGDGFDSRILDQTSKGRTADLFNAAEAITLSPIKIRKTPAGLAAQYAASDDFTFTATVRFDGPYPLIQYRLRAKKPGYYSVGFTGAPVATAAEASEIWQPLIWLDQRVPERAYLTPAFETPLPTAMLRVGREAYALIAHPDEFPFDPLPVFDNSRFGVALKTANGKVSPSLFAPVLGGAGSLLKTGDTIAFRAYAVAEQADDLTVLYERLARRLYGFTDYRHNALSTLDATFDNVVAYSQSPYSRWNKDLKGYSYETDVPGSVKNVSSLQALALALATDNRSLFEDRAYPLIEFVLSREKFLFSLDRNQKIQSPSRRLNGPVAPISELTGLSTVLGPSNNFLLPMALEEYGRSRQRNLDEVQHGHTWQNALSLYQATGDKAYLDTAISGGDAYIAQHMLTRQTKLPRGAFFWPSYVPDFTHLYMLYEATGDRRHLLAAHIAARRYTMLMWMAPKIPDAEILVNKGGKAPVYWYLAEKGHHPMLAPEERVPAWRLSEIGLTSESSGTCSGHRAIFMANLSPWLMRIGHDCGDAFLRETAKASIIGRYRNFPGYHINTARTTIYERADYPLHDPIDLSVNSFHYNHALPMAAMLLDYLVSDVYAKSAGGVSFPAVYGEGYAYIQNKCYGHRPGRFYQDDDVRLWMPAGLVRSDSIELNHVAGIKNGALYLAFSNQSNAAVTSAFSLDPARIKWAPRVAVSELTRTGSRPLAAAIDGRFEVTVPPQGLTVLRLEGVEPRFDFADRFATGSTAHKISRSGIDLGHAEAFLFDFGALGRRVYVYLRDDDTVFSRVGLTYRTGAGKAGRLDDAAYPFEFTLALEPGNDPVTIALSGTRADGSSAESRPLTLG